MREYYIREIVTLMHNMELRYLECVWRFVKGLAE